MPWGGEMLPRSELYCQLEKASSAPLGLFAPAYFHPLICRCFAKEVRSSAEAPCPTGSRQPQGQDWYPLCSSDTSPPQSRAGKWDPPLLHPRSSMDHVISLLRDWLPVQSCWEGEGAVEVTHNPPTSQASDESLECKNITKCLPFHTISLEDNTRRLLPSWIKRMKLPSHKLQGKFLGSTSSSKAPPEQHPVHQSLTRWPWISHQCHNTSQSLSVFFLHSPLSKHLSSTARRICSKFQSFPGERSAPYFSQFLLITGFPPKLTCSLLSYSSRDSSSRWLFAGALLPPHQQFLVYAPRQQKNGAAHF